MNDFMDSLPRPVAWFLVYLIAGGGAATFFAVFFWIVGILTRWTSRGRVAVKDQAGFQSPPVGCDTSAARQPEPVVRVVPWHEWKRSLDLFVSGHITLDDHVEKFSGCIIGKKPEPEKPVTLAESEWHRMSNEARYFYEQNAIATSVGFWRPYSASIVCCNVGSMGGYWR